MGRYIAKEKLSYTHTHTHSDGSISYDELLQYFLSANSLLRERFTHNFVEHTFISAPVCQHCKGMVGSLLQSLNNKDTYMYKM